MIRQSVALLAALALAGCLPPSWGAHSVLHPARRPVEAIPALRHDDLTLQGDGVPLAGWRFPAAVPARGATVVYLHGIGDNRASETWLADKLVRDGFDVLAYDGRAHGASSGAACTYGVREKRDLSRALDQLGVRRAVLLGVSLGGAIALQAAAEDARVAGVVAIATFSDLATIARERAPWFASAGQVRRALALAGREGGFDVADASPVAAASRVRVPVLLVHGGADRETSPDHSRRVLAALAGPKRLRIVEGAGHGDALAGAWDDVESFVREVGAAP